MKALQGIVGAITFTGIHQVNATRLGPTVPDAMPEAAVSAETPSALVLSATEPEASAGPGTAFGAELGSVPGPICGPSSLAKRKSAAIRSKQNRRTRGHFYPRHDAAQPVVTTPTSDQASNPAPV